MSIEITLLGTGSPMVDPHRAGPARPRSSGGGDDWRELATRHFTGRVELGDDLHHIIID